MATAANAVIFKGCDNYYAVSKENGQNRLQRSCIRMEFRLDDPSSSALAGAI